MSADQAAAPARTGCPDGGTCHHECAGACFRVQVAGPLSGVYEGDRWPADVIAEHGTAPIASDANGARRALCWVCGGAIEHHDPTGDGLAAWWSHAQHPADEHDAEPAVTDHAFLPVAGAPDDDECTNRADGTDATYCGRRLAEHALDAGWITETTPAPVSAAPGGDFPCCAPTTTPDDVVARVRAEHRPDGGTPGPGAVCVACSPSFGTPGEMGEPWPCTYAQLLAALDLSDRTGADLVASRRAHDVARTEAEVEARALRETLAVLADAAAEVAADDSPLLALVQAVREQTQGARPTALDLMRQAAAAYRAMGWGLAAADVEAVIVRHRGGAR